MKRISNIEIAHQLSEMAMLYAMQDVAYKPRAYERAAESVSALSEQAADIYERGGKEALAEEIEGVGEAIAEHIAELLETGHFQEYEELKEDIPVDIEELTSVEGVGPQTVKALWEALSIKTLDELEEAAREGRIRDVSGFGEKTEKNILKGIRFVRESGSRVPLGHVLDDIKELETAVAAFDAVDKAAVAGSARRRKETIGDIDILAVSKDGKKVMEQFKALPQVAHVYGSGETKTNVRLTNGLDADLRVVPADSWGAALNYFTGSKAHNIQLRRIALEHGWKLNEYGLYDGEEQIAGRTEEELYKKLGLKYVEPELREMHGEIEAAQNDALPDLIEYGALCGDLQMHTTESDGAASGEEMARAAAERGYEYIAFTDHTAGLPVTGGLDSTQFYTYIKDIEELNKTLEKDGVGITVLAGAEANIGKDGDVDIDEDIANKLDLVGAAVHSHFSLSRDEQTKRIIKAMEHPYVDIIFHLTARHLGKRPSIEIDLEEVLKAAKRTGTILEIDAAPDRLDISDMYIRKCVENGVLMSVGSDAHSTDALRFAELGVAQARRGWARAENIINTRTCKEMRAMLKRNRS